MLYANTGAGPRFGLVPGPHAETAAGPAPVWLDVHQFEKRLATSGEGSVAPLWRLTRRGRV